VAIEEEEFHVEQKIIWKVKNVNKRKSIGKSHYRRGNGVICVKKTEL
jgi:hypothetical protein